MPSKNTRRMDRVLLDQVYAILNKHDAETVATVGFELLQAAIMGASGGDVDEADMRIDEMAEAMKKYIRQQHGPVPTTSQ